MSYQAVSYTKSVLWNKTCDCAPVEEDIKSQAGLGYRGEKRGEGEHGGEHEEQEEKNDFRDK